MSRKPSVGAEPIALTIESMDLEGHGVAHHDGKVVFVRGALPGERVLARPVRSKPRFDVAETVEVLHASPGRVRPRCPHYGVCGGCAAQHVDLGYQVAFKQRALEDTLFHLGRVRPEGVLPPIVGPGWGYRYRARLTVRHVPKKGGVLVGFHEKASRYVADMRECHVLPARISALLVPLRELVEGLSIRDRMPQIELAIGDRFEPVEQPVALVFRVLEPASEADLERLTEFSARHDLEIWLQPKGPDSIWLLAAGGVRQLPGQPEQPDQPRSGSRLAYELPEFGIQMPFAPTDFTQVNASINRQMLARAIQLLDPRPDERVVDFFCGLGNFTLPIATRARRVLGIEGSAVLVARAAEAARHNRRALLAEPGPEGVQFRVANLFLFTPADWAAISPPDDPVDKLLIDPPRDGALELVKVIAESAQRPGRIVYVSCNPATLARDSAILSSLGRYRLRLAGVLNMFPHTAHVESIAVFERDDSRP